MPLAAAASSFSNSVGIDTHIDMIGSSYQNYAQMINAMSYLGVTNVRDTYDDLNDAAEYNQMASLLGVKYDFFLALGAAGVPWQISQIEANPSIVAYVEGFNESDAWWQTYNGLTGPAATKAVQEALYTAVKSDPALAGVGVIQTTFANIANFTTYGNQSAYADYANTHSYFGTGNNPDGGNFANYLISLAQDVTPGKPTITTETGYFTMPGNANGVDQLVQAKYILDMLFEQAQAGVKLTYLWELVDNYADPNNTNSEDHFGLFNADYTPKIAAIALHNLMQIFQDPGTGGVQPGTLNYTLTGMPSGANSSLYEKSDGTFMLVLWNDERLSGPTTQTEINVAPVTVTLTLTHPFTRITVYDPLTGTTAIQEFDNASTVQIAVPDHPVIVELSQVAAPAALAEPTIAAPNQVLTTPGQLVHVDGLSVTDPAVGNYTVQVSSQANGLSLLNTAGHVLANDVDTVTLTGSLATINAELATLTYTGNASLGSDMISVTATDPTGASTTHMIPVSVVAADSAVVSGGPVISVPSVFATATGSTAALPNLTIADPYAATHTDTVTLTVRDTNGQLQVAPGTATVSGNASSALTVTGSLAQVTAALASLTYTAGSAAGPDTVRYSVTDTAMPWYSSSGQTVVTVTPPPTVSGPSFVEVNQGATASLAGIALTDTAAAAGANQVTVTVTDSNGTLTVPAASGVTGSGTKSLTLSGTVAAVNAELAGLQYAIAPGGTSDTVAVRTTDLYGGSATFSVEIDTVNATPPSVVLANPINTSAQATVSAPYLTVQDPATAATNGRVTVTLTSNLGTFSTSAIAGVQVAPAMSALAMSALTLSSTPTANTFTLSGTVAAVNTALSHLSYTASSQAGVDLVNISVTDSLGGGATSRFQFNVVQRPTITLPAAGMVRIGGNLPVRGITVADSYATAQGTPVTVKVTDTIGALSATAGAASLTGSGTHSLSITGTVTQVNAALGTLAYAAGTRGVTDQLVVTETDAYNGTAQQILTETTAAPQFTLPSSQVLNTRTSTALSGISLQDACNGKVAGNLILQISTVANMGGTVSITNLSGAVQTGSGPNAITLTGTLSQLDAALATLSLHFRHPLRPR